MIIYVLTIMKMFPCEIEALKMRREGIKIVWILLEMMFLMGGATQVRFQCGVDKHLAAVTRNTISLLDLDHPQARKHVLKSHASNVQSICWDSSGERLISVSEDSLKIWRMDSGEKENCIRELNVSGKRFHCATFHPSYPSLLIIGCHKWLEKGQFVPVCKPGGHVVIWKLAYEKGVFQWFRDHRRKGATVPQVSNVVAGTDMTMLAMAGIGLHEGKKLGFASCKRNFGATDGINVLVEKGKTDGTWTYGMSCIEYTEFDKFGIADGSHSHNR